MKLLLCGEAAQRVDDCADLPAKQTFFILFFIRVTYIKSCLWWCHNGKGKTVVFMRIETKEKLNETLAVNYSMNQNECLNCNPKD